MVERGVTVDVIERETYLGGRVGGWTEKADDGTDLPMNRGFHAFFRQYYNLRDMLRRIDSELGMLTAVEDYPLVDGQGRRDTFRGLPQTPPLNALAFALRSPTFRLRDLVRLNARAAAPLAAVSVPDIYQRLDHLDADSFLRDINFPAAARHLAFEVFSRSFFAEPGALSAAELATMFHIYFLGSSEGLIFDVANANFDVALWNPVAPVSGVARRELPHRRIRHRGGPPNRDFACALDSGADFDCDGVVRGHRRRGPAAHRRRFTWARRRRLAGPGGDDGHGAAVRGAAAVAGPAGAGRPGAVPRDGRATAAGQCQRARTLRTGSEGVVRPHRRLRRRAALVLGDRDRPTTSATACSPGSMSCIPKSEDAKIVHERVLSRGDCPRFAPGDHAARPTVATPHPAVMLAGDGIRIDLPVALMERAATTGWSAANGLLAHYGLAGHQLHTVPVEGPVCCAAAARAAGSAVGAMSVLDGLKAKWVKSSPFTVLPREQWASQRPTYKDAEPAIIDAALARSQRQAER